MIKCKNCGEEIMEKELLGRSVWEHCGTTYFHVMCFADTKAEPDGCSNPQTTKPQKDVSEELEHNAIIQVLSSD